MVKSPKTKRCSRCGLLKNELEFSKNQYRKNNVIVRRGYCKSCEKKKKLIPSKIKRKYERSIQDQKLEKSLNVRFV